jgi:hypothetical protein
VERELQELKMAVKGQEGRNGSHAAMVFDAVFAPSPRDVGSTAVDEDNTADKKDLENALEDLKDEPEEELAPEALPTVEVSPEPSHNLPMTPCPRRKAQQRRQGWTWPG